MYAIHLKASLSLREPTEWRGGALMCLAKRASAALNCTAFRSILLANVTAKAHHRMLRDKPAPHYAAYKTELQSGQLPGAGVDSLALLVRTYQLRAQHLRQFYAITYFDVKSAFYRVIRQVLFPSHARENDADFLALLHGIGVPSSALPELAQHLQQMAVLADANVPEHVMSQTADLFRGSWFRLDACGPLVATLRGTRPGDPLADLLFAFTFGAYLRGAEKALCQGGLQTRNPPFQGATIWPDNSSPSEIGCIAWADDYTHLQMAPTVPRLLACVSKATSILVTQATSLGMELTYERDKTAILLAATCPRQASELLQQDTEGHWGMRVQDTIAQATHLVPVVDSYRHLGSITVANGGVGPEIQFRFSQAQGALKPLKRRLFASPQIPLELRRTLLRSLILSRFVFSCATLILQVKQYRRRWGQLYLQLWRGLCRRTSDSKQVHSYEVLRQAQAPSPLLALAYARSIFLQRVYQHGPDTLRFLLQAHWNEQPSQSWLGQLRGDIRAVAVYVPAAQHLEAFDSPVRALCESYDEDPTWWPKQVRKASEAFQRDLQVWADKLKTSPDISSGRAGSDASPDTFPYECSVCKASFKLRKHLATHQARAHNMYSVARHYVPLPFCLACHGFYHTITRTQSHVKRSPKCLARLVHVIPPMPLAAILEAEDYDRTQRRKLRHGSWQAFIAAAPALVAFGPRAPIFSEALGALDDDTVTIGRLQRQYRPSASTLRWVMSYIEGASKEGSRAGTAEFWLHRPGA